MSLNPFSFLQHEGAHGSLVDLFGDGKWNFMTMAGITGVTRGNRKSCLLQRQVNSSQIETVKMVWLRKAAVADINNDGSDDLFLIAHGWDRPPFPGEKSLLY